MPAPVGVPGLGAALALVLAPELGLPLLWLRRAALVVADGGASGPGKETTMGDTGTPEAPREPGRRGVLLVEAAPAPAGTGPVGRPLDSDGLLVFAPTGGVPVRAVAVPAPAPWCGIPIRPVCPWLLLVLLPPAAVTTREGGRVGIFMPRAAKASVNVARSCKSVKINSGE
jgi:hypothetical protein